MAGTPVRFEVNRYLRHMDAFGKEIPFCLEVSIEALDRLARGRHPGLSSQAGPETGWNSMGIKATSQAPATRKINVEVEQTSVFGACPSQSLRSCFPQRLASSSPQAIHFNTSRKERASRGKSYYRKD